MSSTLDPNPLWRQVAAHYWLLLQRFSRRYGSALLVLVASAVIGWWVASSVADYTKGGWEVHFIERGIGLNIHFHHWYYGLPLYLIAFLTIEWHATLSIFLFGLGETLAAHSFINEHGIPSIIEGGPTWRVPPEVYFPIATGAALLYAFFIIRREEWLIRAREREEIAESYLLRRGEKEAVLDCLHRWAIKYLVNPKERVDHDADILYGQWHAIDREERGEWQFHYVISPFDSLLDLLVVRLEHIPMQGHAGQIDDLMRELDTELKPFVHPAVGGPEAAIQAFANGTSTPVD